RRIPPPLDSSLSLGARNSSGNPVPGSLAVLPKRDVRQVRPGCGQMSRRGIFHTGFSVPQRQNEVLRMRWPGAHFHNLLFGQSALRKLVAGSANGLAVLAQVLI